MMHKFTCAGQEKVPVPDCMQVFDPLNFDIGEVVVVGCRGRDGAACVALDVPRVEALIEVLQANLEKLKTEKN